MLVNTTYSESCNSYMVVVHKVYAFCKACDVSSPT